VSTQGEDGVNADLFRLNSDLQCRHWWFRARRQILGELMRELVPPSPKTTILDVGCGTGGNLDGLADEYRCVGIDPSAEAIRLARANYPHVRFIRGQAPDDLGREAGRASLVLLADVLEHVPDDRRLLAGLVAAARPGTHFLITVPADASLWSPHDVRHGHYRRYDRDQLERAWRDLPVRPRLVSYFNTRLYPLIKLVRTVGRRRGTTYGASGTDLRLPPSPANRVLERVFRGECCVLRDLLRGKRRAGYSFGVSLIAVLRQEVGAAQGVEVRAPYAQIADSGLPIADCGLQTQE
jgi:SAM-dependent methyltransferase